MEVIAQQPKISPSDISYLSYTGEECLPGVINLIEKDLSEPYSIYTYRYFINQWPKLCILVIF
jgi:peptide alpha-N-acetyltransferase